MLMVSATQPIALPKCWWTVIHDMSSPPDWSPPRSQWQCPQATVRPICRCPRPLAHLFKERTQFTTTLWRREAVTSSTTWMKLSISIPVGTVEIYDIFKTESISISNSHTIIIKHSFIVCGINIWRINKFFYKSITITQQQVSNVLGLFCEWSRIRSNQYPLKLDLWFRLEL